MNIHKPSIHRAILPASLAFCGLIAVASTQLFADRGRGSIRAAPARVEVRQNPVRAPERVPERAPVEARRDVHVEPAHVDARRDWDDNDEDGRHFGGFGGNVAVHVNRGDHFHALPAHHFDVDFNHHHYWLDDTGVYYDLLADGEYVAIQPPVGIVVQSYPTDSIPIQVGPTTYFYVDGVFYVAQPGGFAVVSPPPGIVVPALPTGAAQAVINGVVVYQFNGFNYQPSLQDGVTVYTVNPA
jgi:hypothetical protein